MTKAYRNIMKAIKVAEATEGARPTKLQTLRTIKSEAETINKWGIFDDGEIERINNSVDKIINGIFSKMKNQMIDVMKKLHIHYAGIEPSKDEMDNFESIAEKISQMKYFDIKKVELCNALSKLFKKYFKDTEENEKAYIYYFVERNVYFR